ncbi:MAG: MucB/RseB C-terminal domain-containing protein [Betaproteobacteria bacterium]|nr:MucB/RseB C-terminal domain-containing protein [Betaproteobacteria bacterium]
MNRVLGALLLCMVAGWAQAQTTPEALDWLRKIYRATEKLSYTGTFVYQQGDRTETSRIARLAGPSGGTEKLEVLDGTPREILRTRDEIRCYLPESRTVKVDRRSDTRAFPAVLPEQVGSLAEHYEITLGETRRIAGYDCQAVLLTPKDDLRYGYKLWADTRSGMLLKARTFDRNGHTMEQFTFTQLRIGSVPRERLQPPRAIQGWRVEQAGVAPADLAQAGWSVSAQLPGFRKIVEIRRMLRDTQPVAQMVYSDGLAAVSVFIEPMSGRVEDARIGIASMGAVNVYTREVANHWVTVVGEAPAASVQRIGNTVEYRPR